MSELQSPDPETHRDRPQMRVEHSLPDSSTMQQLDVDTHIRIWFNHDTRFIDIHVGTSREYVMIEHYQAPGGFSYRSALTLQPNGSNGIVIK